MGKGKKKDKQKSSGPRSAGIEKRRPCRKAKQINRSSSTSSLESNGAEVDKGGRVKYHPNVREPKCTFDELRGIDEVKETLLQEIIWPFANPEKASALKAEIPKGILLTGKPGTGKTCLADGIVSEIMKEGRDVRYYEETGALLDCYLGESEKKLRSVFQTAAETAPSVIFFDELDGLGGKRGESGASSTMNTIVTTFLTEMNRIENGKVLIIAATNHPELCDQALIRPGRFDIRLDLPLPDLDGRIAIVAHYLLKKGVTVVSRDLRKICREMKDFSGSDLKTLVERSWSSFLNRMFPGGVWRNISVEDLAEKLKPEFFDIELDVRQSLVRIANAKLLSGTAEVKTEPMDVDIIDLSGDGKLVMEPDVLHDNFSMSMEDIIASTSCKDISNKTPGHKPVEENNKGQIYGDFRKLPDLPLQKIFSYLDFDDLLNCSEVSNDMRKLVFPSLIISSFFCLGNEDEINDLVDYLQTKVLPLDKRISLSINSEDFTKSSTLLELFQKCGDYITHLKVWIDYNFSKYELVTSLNKNVAIPILRNKQLLPSLESIEIIARSSNRLTSFVRCDDQSYYQVELMRSIFGNAPALKEICVECGTCNGMTSLLFKFIDELGLAIKILKVCTGSITDSGLGYLTNLSLEEVDFFADYELNEPHSFTNFLESQRQTLKHLRLVTFEEHCPIPQFTFPKMEMLETLEVNADLAWLVQGPRLPIANKDQAPKLKRIEFTVGAGNIDEAEFFPSFISEPTRSIKEVTFSIPNIHASNIRTCARLFECLTKLTIPVHEGLICGWKDLSNLEELELFPADAYNKQEFWIDTTITGIPMSTFPTRRNSDFTDEYVKIIENRYYRADRSIEILKKLRLLRLRRSLLKGYSVHLTDLPFRLVLSKMESLKCIDFYGMRPSFVGASKEVLDETEKKIDLLFGQERD